METNAVLVYAPNCEVRIDLVVQESGVGSVAVRRFKFTESLRKV